MSSHESLVTSGENVMTSGESVMTSFDSLVMSQDLMLTKPKFEDVNLKISELTENIQGTGWATNY